MRCLLIPLLFFFAASLIAQSSTDTIFWENGTPQQVLHYHSIESDQLSKAQLFQRGIRQGDDITKIRMRDSVRLYDESGTYLKTMSSGERNSRGIASRNLSRKKGIQPADEDVLKFNPTVQYLEGRAKMRIRKKVILPFGKTFKEVQRLDEHSELEILQTPADTNGSFTVKICIPAGATTPKLRLDIGEETDWEKPFSLRGYHLNETDFKRRDLLTEAQTWRAKDQEYLYLRLRSTEKLMYIYRDDEQYTVLPIGRQLDEVRVGALPEGKYLLEIIDLGTREKRYHWIIAGK